MDEFGPDEQRWLDVLRAADEPSEADRVRMRASVFAIVAGAGTSAAAGAGGLVKAASGATGAFTVPWKLGVILLSIALAGGGGFLAVLANGSTPKSAPAPLEPAPAAQFAPMENPAVGLPPTAAPKAAKAIEDEAVKAPSDPSARGSTHRAPHANRASLQNGADDVEAELVLLTEAQQALERGDANAALQALARHGRAHPLGALAVEREGLRAIASCAAKRDDGRALAERFVARNPNSPLVARVTAACLSP